LSVVDVIDFEIILNNWNEDKRFFERIYDSIIDYATLTVGEITISYIDTLSLVVLQWD